MASAPSPVVWVQVAQALVARELVEEFGLPERAAARRLGIVPSAVSQYLSGKRLAPTLSRYASDEVARRIARRTAQRLASLGEVSGNPGILLETAIELAEQFGPSGPRPVRGAGRGPLSRGPDPALKKWIRARIAGEQVAVAECMRLAQRSRDELTRAIFRQIASDSLRHAEIVGSLAAYLDRGIDRTVPSGITRADVRRLIAREEAAEVTDQPERAKVFGGVMQILWESMESDEQKHRRLLELLLGLELPGDPPAPRPARPARRRVGANPAVG
ncbi:MAG: hypothetical protein L3K08_00180 [Thermoplasmata archaeon]|nr:hypothetical protein [Thermoplasmata archaeon]